MSSPQVFIRLNHFNPQKAQCSVVPQRVRKVQVSAVPVSLAIKGNGSGQLSPRWSQLDNHTVYYQSKNQSKHWRENILPTWQSASCLRHGVSIALNILIQYTNMLRAVQAIPVCHRSQLRENHHISWPQLFTNAHVNEHKCPCPHKVAGSLLF